MNLVNDIKYQYRNGGILVRLIMLNVAVYLVMAIISLPFYLSNNGNVYGIFLDWLAVPAQFSGFLVKPWTIFTYMFLHNPTDIFHILFNMLMLYFSGRLFVEYLGQQRLLPTYILGGIFGALLFLLTYNIFPVFETQVNNAILLGASASVLAVIIAISAYIPEYTVHLMFIGPIRLKYFALMLIVLDLISIDKGNPGGHIAHMGGAMYGLLYAFQLKKGNDIASSFNRFTGKINSLFAPKSKLKVSHRSSSTTGKPSSDKEKQKVMDAILDKISKSGYESLTKDEKDILFRISNEK